jgi:hypothetical protein
MRGVCSQKVLREFESLSPVRALAFPRPSTKPPTVGCHVGHIQAEAKLLTILTQNIKTIKMNSKTIFYIINILIYPLIFSFIIPFIIRLSRKGSTGGDAMGNAMSVALEMTFWGIFLVLVVFIISTIVAKNHSQSFTVPLISLVVGLALSFVVGMGPTIIESRQYHYTSYSYYDSGAIKRKYIHSPTNSKKWKIIYYNEDGTIEKIEKWNNGSHKTKWK